VGRIKYNDMTDPDSKNGGHATLIFGYVVINGEYRFLIKDSWGGATYWMSYEKLYNGRNAQPDEVQDDGIWRSCIVVNEEYATIDNTIPYYFSQ